MFGFWLMNVLIEKIHSLVQKEYIFLHERYTLFWGKIYSYFELCDVPLRQGVMCLYISFDVPLHQVAM